MEDSKGFLFWSALALCGMIFLGAVVQIIGGPQGAKARRTAGEAALLASDQPAAKPSSATAKPSSPKERSDALARARKRIERFSNSEGWHRAFPKTAVLSQSGYVCGHLYGETDKDHFGWEFTVRFIYDPKDDEIDVLNWALINHQPGFEQEWDRLCPKRVGPDRDIAETKKAPEEKPTIDLCPSGQTCVY